MNSHRLNLGLPKHLTNKTYDYSFTKAARTHELEANDFNKLASQSLQDKVWKGRVSQDDEKRATAKGRFRRVQTRNNTNYHGLGPKRLTSTSGATKFNTTATCRQRV